MAGPDEALEALRVIRRDFTAFCAARGKVTEADTRAQVIDRVLEEVCGWPKSAIDRERYVRGAEDKRSFIDYGLEVQGKVNVLVEAKRHDLSFDLPVGIDRRPLKLSGTILTEKDVREAILQVRNYCDELGVRFAIATNGYAWIVFRAVRDDIPWRNGHARVFPTIESIEDNFTSFWNLLSYTAISNGSLLAEFSSSLRPSRALHRISAQLFNASLPLERNRLHGQLGPIIKTFFEDIGDLDQIRILQECYVHSGSLRIVADDLNLVITDAAPRLLQDQGVKEIVQTHDSSGDWGVDIARAMDASGGELFLLLGGIGCGKTTFLKRYQRTVGRPLLEDSTYWFHIPFLGPPSDPTQIEVFICSSILDQLRLKYGFEGLERRDYIKKAYYGQLSALNETMFGGLRIDDAEYERAISPQLARWQENTVDYVPRLLRTAKALKNRTVVLFIDNVDQLPPAYQQQIFVAAQGLTQSIGSVTVVALREESYYTANTQKTFTAYATRKFHIASPRFRSLIRSRINLALDVLNGTKSEIDIPTKMDLDRVSIADFLRIVEYSIFQTNQHIAVMIEALCFGNMRQALDWFSTFLISGATDVDKMLNIYRREGRYYVAFHEFVKSIMLSERRYYSEQHSPIMNVFDCGAERNSSHFTTLRLVALLLDHAGQDSTEGRGYVELNKAASAFDDVFDNREDFVRTCNRCLKKQLIEVNTRSTETLEGGSHIRATSAGWYYLRYLVNSFAYLDLVLQDTAYDDSNVEAFLRDSVLRVDNLGDRDRDKMERLEERFTRVDEFLRYLESEESRERAMYGLSAIGGPLGAEWTPVIRREYEYQRDWIRGRIRENRERYAEDMVAARGLAPDEQAFLTQTADRED